MILTPNHADEKDFEVATPCAAGAGAGSSSFFMMNREACSEGFGVAHWWLQRLGAFSVKWTTRTMRRIGSTSTW